jgi:hypothetical protein
MLARSFIKKFISEYKALIFKFLKKRLLVNKKQLVRYIINYYSLNANTIKNKYLLLLMLKLKDKLIRAKILLKINL